MEPRTCPSAPATDGALLIGLRGAEGRILPLRTAMTVDADFIAAAAAEGPPEARMRFASPCQTSGCAQWTGQNCGVIARVLDHLRVARPEAEAAALPPCVIRGTCRWFAERGAEACGACTYVITDQSMEPA